jgi:hypothetical protein
MADLNPLKQYIEIFGKEKIFEWIFFVPNFYYRPLYFFRDIFKKSSKEKLTISLFYISIASLLYYIFTNLTIKEVIQQTIIEVLVLIVSFSILNTTRLLIKWIDRTNLKAEDIFYFLLITKALSLPIQTIFFVIFNFSEKYEFLFVHNLLLVFLILFIIIFSNLIFYKYIKCKILGIVLNILFFNIFLIALDRINFDEYLTDFKLILQTDEINDEFNLKISSCDSLWMKCPKNKFLVVSNSDAQVFSLYTFKENSQSTIPNITSESINEDQNFKKGILQKIEEDSLINYKFRFKRNKFYNEKLIAYLKQLRKDINNPYIKSQTKVIEVTTNAKKGKDKTNFYKVAFDENVFKKYNNFSDEIISFYHEKEFAEFPKKAMIIVAFPFAIYYNNK